jgi:uncharacterized protein (DUF1684 family)
MNLETLLRMRADRDLFFAEHYSSPLPEEHQSEFNGLDYFDPDPAWDLTAVYDRIEPTKVPVPSTAGNESLYTMMGTASVMIGDTTYRLTVLDDGDGGAFVPFRDATCGSESYGGGRYVGIAIANDRSATIDFNTAQNPWCVYDEEFACPLPPPGNVISEPIHAGEKMYREPRSD